MRSFGRLAIAVALVAAVLPAAPRAQSTQAATLYKEARSREDDLRKQLAAVPASRPKPAEVIERMRILAQTYEDLWHLFPTSPYSDDALWHGAMLAGDVFRAGGDPADRATALQLFKTLTSTFPTSSLVKGVPAQVKKLEDANGSQLSAGATVSRSRAVPQTATSSANASPSRSGQPPAPAAASPQSRTGQAAMPPAAAPVPSRTQTVAPPASGYALLTAIRREVLPDVLRVTLELQREPVFLSERIDGPPRVFIDMQNTRASDQLQDASMSFTDDVVRHIRVGRQLNGRTRVVLDLSGAGKYSVYPAYNPFRIVVDFARKLPGAPVLQASASTSPAGRALSGPPGNEATKPRPATPEAAIPPLPPAANSSGSFSLSRQLGLGIARIVIDPGHGGHDPGAQVKGLSEADVTLDIALRLEKLFARQSGMQVVLTRRDDRFVPLQERTAIANRDNADLFLSIHANANEDASLRGVETYFLNLSPDPDAARVVARENASSSQTMHEFADIVKAIALNDKIDESRDFATIVQRSLYEKLRASNRATRNLGVKQAPFVVLIGATMPSILAEISFMTNRQEAALLKTDKYRQQIAEALYQGVMRYQQSLKKVPAIAQVE